MKKPEFFKKIRHIHFVGIKGVGMTSLACCAQDLGIKVSGSDIEEVFVTDKILKQRKIHWKIGFEGKHLKPRPDLVITTGAHGGLANPEVVAAGKLKIPILTQAQALGKFMEGKEGISVCGVGGKTTTSSMIATVLDNARRNPSFAIGVGEINSLGPGGRHDKGKEFIAEADEYANSPGIDNRPRFSFQKPKVIVVTNVEYDHPDMYQNLEQTKEVFKKFFQVLPTNGLLVACVDNPNTWDAVKDFQGNLQTYGFSPRADWQVVSSYLGQEQIIFSLSHKKVIIDEIKIKVPGRYNVLNATAAFAVGTFLGLDVKTIKNGLERFTGTKRRFEFIGEINGIKIYDDYAHHPNEIKEVLMAAKKWFPQNRLIAVFQPHTFSRTKALFNEFARAFSQAKIVVVTDIYSSARETDTLGISGKLLAEETRKYHSNVVYKSSGKEVVEFLKNEAKPNDIIMTLGAGNIFQWHKSILEALRV